MVWLPVVGLRGIARPGGRGRCFGELTVELSPLLLGPPQLLDRGCQVQEVDGNDRGPGAEVGVADESVELSSCRRQPLVNLPEPFDLLGGVALWLYSQNQAPS